MAVYRVHPEAQRPTGPHPEGIAYPFVDPSDDLVGLLDSVWLSIRGEPVRPLRIAWLYGFANFFDTEFEPGSSDGDQGSSPYEPTHDADLVVLGADDEIVFDSTTAAVYDNRQFGPRLWIHEWIADEAVCRVVQHAAFPSIAEAVDYPLVLEPERSNLDVRTWETMPQRVLSLTAGGELVNDQIELVAGYNIDLAVRDGQAGDSIESSLAPGGGDGHFPCSSSDYDLATINQVRPDANGNFTIKGLDCTFSRQAISQLFFDDTLEGGYWQDVLNSLDDESAAHADLLEMESVAGNFVWLGDDCSRGCQPYHYVNAYRALKLMVAARKEIGLQLEAMRVRLQTLTTRYEASLLCNKDQSIRVNVLPTSASSVAIRAGFCNNSTECVSDVAIVLDVTVNNMPDSSIDCDPRINVYGSVASKSRARDGLPALANWLVEELPGSHRYTYTGGSMLPVQFLTGGLGLYLPCADENTSVTVVGRVTIGGEFKKTSTGADMQDTVTVGLGDVG